MKFICLNRNVRKKKKKWIQKAWMRKLINEKNIIVEIITHNINRNIGPSNEWSLRKILRDEKQQQRCY